MIDFEPEPVWGVGIPALVALGLASLLFWVAVAELIEWLL